MLDTHVWLDIVAGRKPMAPRALRKVDAAAADRLLYIAAITPWEIAMLSAAGKVKVAGPTLEWLNQSLRATQTSVAPLDPAIAVDAVELPSWAHRDPADRLIVATARFLGALLLTRDSEILDYAETVKAVRVMEPS
ncbi:MAG: type II toxin-antitoxin system VapC family toxin [Polyangiaceae bacterium]